MTPTARLGIDVPKEGKRGKCGKAELAKKAERLKHCSKAESPSTWEALTSSAGCSRESRRAGSGRVLVQEHLAKPYQEGSGPTGVKSCYPVTRASV